VDGFPRPRMIKCVLLGLGAAERVWMSPKSPIEKTIRSSAKDAEKEDRRVDSGGVWDRRVSLCWESG
jgi:hypothetical protein